MNIQKKYRKISRYEILEEVESMVGSEIKNLIEE